MLRRILVKLLVLVSVCLLVSCASSDDEYEDDAEIENSNSEDVAMSDDSQEQGENGNDENNEDVNNEFNENNEGQMADGENNGDEGWQENNGENLGFENNGEAVEGGDEVAESTDNMSGTDMVEDVNGGNPVDPVLNNGGAGNQVTETTQEVTEETQTQIPSNASTSAPSYEVGAGVVKYVTKNTSVYGEKNSGFAVGSYEVGDHPLVIEDDGTYATTSSGKVVPSNALTERAIPRPRRSVEYR